MDKSSEPKNETRGNNEQPKKAPYAMPRLTRYGDIAALTCGVNATGTDSGAISM